MGEAVLVNHEVLLHVKPDDIHSNEFYRELIKALAIFGECTILLKHD